MELWDVITRFVLPPILGGAGGYLTVWLNWDVEKRRTRMQRRAEMVQRWRTNLLPELGNKGGYVKDKGGHALTVHPDYPSLRQHLSEEMRDTLEEVGDAIVVVGNGAPHLRRRLMNEIDRIEKQWGLV